MEKIKDFRINLNSDSLENVKKIKDKVENFVSENDIKNLSFSLSSLLDIPVEVINKKIKKIVYNHFDYYDKDPKFKINFSLFSSIKYFFLFTVLILFKKKLKLQDSKKKKIDIILDNVEKNYVLEKFSKTLSYFDSCLILHNKSLSRKKIHKNTLFFLTHSFFFSNSILKGKTILFFKFITQLFYLSKKKELNLIKIFFIIFYSSLKYNKIFSLYESNFLIHDRIYNSCPIRNYIFKKNGGSKVFCLQSHLAEGTISVFNDIDVLVTFGEENDTKKKLELLGAKINDSIVCGSIRMERALSNLQKLDEINEVDILLIGINIANWVGTSKNIIDIYYKHLEWITKISKKYPKLKITIKHHPNYRGDYKEDNIIKKTNIETIINPSNNLNSYHFLLKSKLILSFGSTMILEGSSLRSNCFFLDPDGKNTTFFDKLDYLQKIRITNFDDLDTLVQKHLINNNKILNLDNNKFCLPHQNASQNLFKNIRRIGFHEHKNIK